MPGIPPDPPLTALCSASWRRTAAPSARSQPGAEPQDREHTCLSPQKGHILGIPKPKASKSERRAGQHTAGGTEALAQNAPLELFDLI